MNPKCQSKDLTLGFRCLIKKIGTTPFLKLIDWLTAVFWVLNYSTEIDNIITKNPDLKDIYDKFTKQNPWKDELKTFLREHKEDLY
ncbi:MAG: hypothetical protein NT009_10005 [Proteobacteria bacterium]|nr:hypothetical protein [Pseudomonadota bacterium]